MKRRLLVEQDVIVGDENLVCERFEAAGIPAADVHFERATWLFRHDGSPADLLALFRDYYGPTMNAFEAASKFGRERQLEGELTALFAAHNRGSGRTEIPATFLKVTVARR